MKLSIVLCTFNGSRHLPELLDSLASQDRLPDELIITDDCSKDQTPSLLEAFGRTAPFPVRLELAQTRVGSTANFARSLARATGEVVALADQDDIWRRDKLSRVEACFAAYAGTSALISDAELIDGSGQRLRSRLWSVRGLDGVIPVGGQVDPATFARRPIATGATMVVSRRVIETALPFPEELLNPAAPMRHDRWLSLVAAGLGPVRTESEPLIWFRIHPEQETGVLIGASGRHRLRSALSSTLASTGSRVPEHAALADQMGVAAERVGDAGGDPEPLVHAAEHERFRATLPARRVPRIGSVLSELRRRRYGPGAAGSVLADLLRR